MLFLFLGESKETHNNLINFKKNFSTDSIIAWNEEQLLLDFLLKAQGGSLFKQKMLFVIEAAKIPIELKEEKILNLLKNSASSDFAVRFDEKLPKSHPLQKLAFEFGRIIGGRDENPRRLWILLDALGSKNLKKALSELYLTLDNSEDPIFLNLMIAYLLRNLLRAKGGAANGINPISLRKLREQKDLFSEEELKQRFTEVFENDLALKEGENPKLILTVTVNRLCSSPILTKN